MNDRPVLAALVDALRTADARSPRVLQTYNNGGLPLVSNLAKKFPLLTRRERRAMVHENARKGKP